jgi:hypothetical protein
MYKKYINGKKKNYNIFFKNCKECVWEKIHILGVIYV